MKYYFFVECDTFFFLNKDLYRQLVLRTDEKYIKCTVYLWLNIHTSDRHTGLEKLIDQNLDC